MPVIVQLLQQPTDQDRADLGCLEREHPQLIPVMASWQSNLAMNQASECWVARFNNRILGAAWAMQRQLVAIAVRQETQGRGVATRLLTKLTEARTLTLSTDLARVQWPLLHSLFGVKKGDS